jgi:hypothetical protein
MLLLLPVVVVVVVAAAAAAAIKDGWDLSEIHCKFCLVWNGDTHISKQDRKCKYV